MPSYSYRDEHGRLVELHMTYRQKAQRERRDGSIRLRDGTVVTRDVAADHRGFRGTPGNYPMRSAVLGVQPWEREKARKHSEAAGVPTDFAADGDAIIRDKKHMREYTECRGFFQKHAGYSDAVKGGYTGPEL